MLAAVRCALVVLSAGLATALPAAPSFPQKAPLLAPASYQSNSTRLDAVAAAFKRSWQGYLDDAFPSDSLLPIKGGGKNDRNGWGASAVDALSTAIVMGDAETVSTILDFVPRIDFSKTGTEVSLFETTIRYLGGLLSGYDLLKGPRSGLAPDEAVEPLLTQARALADNLKFAFDTPSGVPDNSLFLNPEPHTAGSEYSSLATAGTLVLEWTRLSDLTGDPTYGDLTQRAQSYLLAPEPRSSEPFPGLVGTIISISNGTFLNDSGGWGGDDDSFYEYLIKMYLYDPVRFELYRDRWIQTAESSITFLASHPTTRPDLTFLANFDGTKLSFTSSHLTCFDGGNFILGGLVLRERKFVDFGIELTNACHETYAHTETGIGPEGFSWQDSKMSTSDPQNPGPPARLSGFYSGAGFWISNGAYGLRPEVIESYYYAYRATGDPKYQEWAWQAFVNINRTCAAGSGFSGITDVTKSNGGSFFDHQESFWFAEVMKYSYLIHAEESEFQVKTDGNTFVFNTEAHPLRIPTPLGKRI